MSVALGLIICLEIGTLAAAEPDPSVEAGRQALGQWNRYPWYDADTDSAKPIDIVPDRKTNWNRSGGSMWGGWSVGRMLQVLGLGILGVFLGVLIYLMVRKILDREPVDDDDPESDDLGEELEDLRRFDALPPTQARRKANLLEEAARCYREGDYGEAIVYLFSYQLFQLDRYQLIRLTRGKTNRQYVRELGGQIELGRLLTATMLAFEDVFFGNHKIDRVRFESCWLRLDEFESLAGKGE